ncbi:type II toxin-antitoxin system RelE/ParE family toxin [Ligilactobacillus agilis]|uniref:type II toxin-antitoxin system RelE/ParE family toxin n=1 Tax=Ligilactobacillus agilis TaxID=1601 RepID=UPI0030B9FC5C
MVIDIKLEYKNKKVKKLCTNIAHAKKNMDSKIATKLHSLINLLEESKNLQDVNAFLIYNLHKLVGDRSGNYALDIGGRRAGYRLIIKPLNEDNNQKMNLNDNLIEFYSNIEIVRIEEVSKHYE